MFCRFSSDFCAILYTEDGTKDTWHSMFYMTFLVQSDFHAILHTDPEEGTIVIFHSMFNTLPLVTRDFCVILCTFYFKTAVQLICRSATNIFHVVQQCALPCRVLHLHSEGTRFESRSGCPRLYRAPSVSPGEYRNILKQTSTCAFTFGIEMKQESRIKIFRDVTPCRLVYSYRLLFIIYTNKCTNM